jgi:hypothetical protein
MVNHSIRKLGDWQQPIKFKESIYGKAAKKNPKRQLGIFFI